MEVHGVEWLTQTWRYIQEDKAEDYRVLATLIPLAKTPMDKESGRSQQQYTKAVMKMLSSMTPWRKDAASRGAHLRGKAKPGEVVVILDGGDTPDHPLYAGAKITRE